MSMKSYKYRVLVTEHMMVGKQTKFQQRPNLNFTIEADCPSEARKAAKAQFRDRFDKMYEIISCTCGDRKVNMLISLAKQ